MHIVLSSLLPCILRTVQSREGGEFAAHHPLTSGLALCNVSAQHNENRGWCTIPSLTDSQYAQACRVEDSCSSKSLFMMYDRPSPMSRLVQHVARSGVISVRKSSTPMIASTSELDPTSSFATPGRLLFGSSNNHVILEDAAATRMMQLRRLDTWLDFVKSSTPKC